MNTSKDEYGANCKNPEFVHDGNLTSTDLLRSLFLLMRKGFLCLVENNYYMFEEVLVSFILFPYSKRIISSNIYLFQVLITIHRIEKIDDLDTKMDILQVCQHLY